MHWTERSAREQVFKRIEVMGIEAARNTAEQLDPHRRIGYEAGLRHVHTEQAYRELDTLVAREAGAAGISLAELDDLSDFAA